MLAMNNGAESLPDDPEKLKGLIAQLQEQIEYQQAQIDHKTGQINQLLEAIQLAKQQHFGTRSDKHDIDQLSFLFNEAEALADHETMLQEDKDDSSEDSTGTEVKGHIRRKGKGGRKKLPDHFPRIEVVHALEGDKCRCDHCQGQLQVMSHKTSEQLELVPMTIKVIRHVKRTYHCPNCKQGIKAAKLPPQPIPGSIASPGTLACVATGKYVNGVPLYRQEQDLKRHDIPITRSTLAFWMIKSGLLGQPLINLMNERLLNYDIISMDETRCQVLKEPGKDPQSQSFMWVRRGGPPDQRIILYDYAPTRSQQVPIDLLGDYAGYLQTDGYDGYTKVCDQNEIIQLGCWAHVRNKFDQALKAQKQLKLKKTTLTAQALNRIRLLYKIEKRAKKLNPDQRLALRQQYGIPILKDLRQWLDKHLMVLVKQSALGKAMHYMDKQWPKLMVYTDDGRLNIDNNLVENSIRPFVIGRKNHLFSDTVSGAKASANLYSLIETAKANGLEPYAYLKHVFTELPKATCVEEIEALLPFKTADELEQAA